MAERRTEPAKGLSTVLRWLALLWAIEVLDAVITYTRGIPPQVPHHHPGWLQGGALDYALGLRPGDPWGAIGILTAPFLHAGWSHLVANSLALVLLLWISLGFSRRLTWAACAISSLTAGILTWLIAPTDTVHVGASGVIFGLVGFLLVNGVVRKGCLPLLISLGVLVLYGGALGGMLPWVAEPGISWQMHLGGFVGGVVTSWGLRRQKA